MTAIVRPVDFNLVVKREAIDFLAKRFADFVGQHERGLVLAVQIARELASRYAFHRVHENADRGDQIGERHFARGEDCPARYRVLVKAISALEFAARRDGVMVERATARAHRRAKGFRPADFAEGERDRQEPKQ